MTAIKSGEIARFVASGWRNYPVILVHGSDEGSVRETGAALVAAAAGSDPDPMNLIRLDGETIAQDPPRLADELRTFGLFGGQRVIHVRNATRAPVAVIAAAADEPTDQTILILEAGDMRKDAPLRTLADRHRQIAGIVCYADDTRNILGLIDRTFSATGQTLTREARDLLLAALGADRSLSRSEIEKLALYSIGKTEIDAAMVSEIVADAGRHEVSALIDLTFAGQFAAIEPEANRLFAAGTSPSGLLSQTITHIFLLRRISRALSGGQSLDQMARTYRFHFSRSAMVERAVRTFSERHLERALRLVADALLQTRRVARLDQPIAIRTLWSIARLTRNDPS